MLLCGVRGTEAAYPAMLRCYALSGTEIVYGGGQPEGLLTIEGQYCHGYSGIAGPVLYRHRGGGGDKCTRRGAVLTYAMTLPVRDRSVMRNSDHLVQLHPIALRPRCGTDVPYAPTHKLYRPTACPILCTMILLYRPTHSLRTAWY
eukprot:3941337-Rhodomonas_salina.2